MGTSGCTVARIRHQIIIIIYATTLIQADRRDMLLDTFCRRETAAGCLPICHNIENTKYGNIYLYYVL